MLCKRKEKLAMRRIAIELDDSYFEALERLAKQDRRSVRSFTAILVEKALHNMNAVKLQQEPTTQSTQHHDTLEFAPRDYHRR